MIVDVVMWRNTGDGIVGRLYTAREEEVQPYGSKRVAWKSGEFPYFVTNEQFHQVSLIF
jgi:hypothetical protein